MKGRVLADRFVVGEPIGRGGMGAVHRATDRDSGAEVAVKLLLPWAVDERAVTRFEREATLLAQLDHPAIVKYVAHGREEDGTHFLGMEWIEGVDLGQHLLEAAPLSLDCALEFAEALAFALGCLHAIGATHRDVKPGNILLRGGDVRKPVLADLGIAHVEGPRVRKTTKPGSIVGTLGYMAPEQARGKKSDARTDVFALGCVLYECLSGQPAFTGESPRALALKILVADVVPLSRLVSVPRSLEPFVARLLAKEPSDRPDDGTVVAKELAEVRRAIADAPTRRTASIAPPGRITVNERHLVTTLLFPGAAESFTDTATMDAVPESDPALEPVLSIAHRLGGQTAQLRDGTLLVFFEGIGDARQQVGAAARIALEGHGTVSSSGVAIATGVAELAGYVPTGAAIDRAVGLIKEVKEGEIVVDAVSTRLLKRDHLLERHGEHYRLTAYRPVSSPPQFRLLGRRTEVIGRERPLRAVESTIRRALGAHRPRALLVTGASGMGKTRFLYEAEQRLSSLTPRLHVMQARANPASQDEGFSLIAQLLRSAESDVTTTSRRALGAGEAYPGEEFVAELLRVPVDEPSVQLATARRDPQVMGDQLRHGLLALLARTAAKRPVLLVTDDLQFADAESLDLLGRALAADGAGPLVVLAASRTPLPQDRRWPELEEVPLRPLSKDACIEVVRSALGDTVADARASVLVERSEGNPFWLEELVRLEATGAADALPESVVASVQARLGRMPAEARRLLRAASVFGLEFQAAPVATLAGLSDEQREMCLKKLVDEDLIFPSDDGGGAIDFISDSIFPRQSGKYDLRHDVIRRAAYEMLTEADRRAAHAAAAAWLEGLIGYDPRLVADHYELADMPDRAVRAHGEAAELALGFSDFAGAMERASRGLAAVADDPTAGWLHHLRAEAAYWAGEPEVALAHASQVAPLVERASARWLEARRIECAIAVRHGAMSEVLAIAADVAKVDATSDDARALAATSARLAAHTFLAGNAPLGEVLLSRAERHLASATDDLALAAIIHEARAQRAELDRDFVAERAERLAASDIYHALGDRRRESIARTNLGVAEMHIGLFEAARASLERARALANDVGVSAAAAAAECNLGHVIALAGEPGLGRTMLAASSVRARATSNRRFEGAAAAHLARLELSVDRPAAALRASEEACSLLSNAPTLYGYALATRAESLLAHDRAASALPLAREATEAARAGKLEEGDIYARVVHARVCAAAGAGDEARTILAEALGEVERRARCIEDDAQRRAFLERIPEHVAASALRTKLAARS